MDSDRDDEVRGAYGFSKPLPFGAKLLLFVLVISLVTAAWESWGLVVGQMEDCAKGTEYERALCDDSPSALLFASLAVAAASGIGAVLVAREDRKKSREQQA